MMKNMKKTILFAVVLVFALGILMTGCKPGTGTDNDGTGSGTSFKDILSGKATAYKVTYDITSNYGGQALASKMSYEIKGTDKFRWDMYDTTNKLTATMLLVDNNYYVCSSQGDQQVCYKMAQQETQQNPDADLLSYADETKYSPVFSGTKVIAGTTAQCYTVSGIGADIQYSSQVCVSKEGILLYMKSTTPQGTSEMTATEYSTTVPDSDFAVPANVQDMTQYATGQ